MRNYIIMQLLFA